MPQAEAQAYDSISLSSQSCWGTQIAAAVASAASGGPELLESLATSRFLGHKCESRHLVKARASLTEKQEALQQKLLTAIQGGWVSHFNDAALADAVSALCVITDHHKIHNEHRF